MQCLISSNTLYKNRYSLGKFGISTAGEAQLWSNGRPAVFLKQHLFSPPSWYKPAQLIIDFQHQGAKKKFACQRGSKSSQFYYSFISWYLNGSSLMQFCSTLPYKCKKDVQFKEISHAEIARRERESWMHLHNP